MNQQYLVNNTDNLLLHSTLQTRELSQKKNEINQQIKVCRTSIAELRSFTETMHRDIKKLEGEISVKQSAALHDKDAAKSIKSTNSLLLYYEQTLKAELETRKASFNHDTEVHEERISSYQKTFQSHKECYLKNPLAQKLLMLQAETEEIECRIRSCDDQIAMKQRELDHLTVSALSTSATERLPDSVFVQSSIRGQEEQSEHQTNEDTDSPIDISSLHLKQTANNHKTSVDVNAEGTDEQNKVQGSLIYGTSPEKVNNEPWSHPQLNEQDQADEVKTGEQEQEASQEEQKDLCSSCTSLNGKEPTVSGVEDALEDEMQERVAIDEENPPAEEDNQTDAVFPQTSSQEANPQSEPGKTTAVPSTPTFTFSLSPTSSPHRGTSDTKSPAFLFSLNSNTSTPGFTAFGFNAGSSQDEDPSFAFTGSLFHDKKATEAKPPECPEFLFGQPEQSEDFHFAFTAKSPHSGSKENPKDEFPFSFNF